MHRRISLIGPLSVLIGAILIVSVLARDRLECPTIDKIDLSAQVQALRRGRDSLLLDMIERDANSVLDAASMLFSERESGGRVIRKCDIVHGVVAGHASNLALLDQEHYSYLVRHAGLPFISDLSQSDDERRHRMPLSGAFWSEREDCSFVLVLRSEDGTLWVGALPDVDGAVAGNPSSIQVDGELVLASDGERGRVGAPLAWWSIKNFKREFLDCSPSASIWGNATRIDVLWHEALEVASHECDLEGALGSVELKYVNAKMGHAREVAPIEYVYSSRVLEVDLEAMAYFRDLSGSDVLGDEAIVRLVLIHEAVHVVDLDRSPGLRGEFLGQDLAIKTVATALLEGHADDVAAHAAATPASREVFELYRRRRQRAMRLASVSLERRFMDTKSALAIGTIADVYDIGLRVIQSRRRRDGSVGVKALLLDPPRQMENLFEELR